MTACLLCMQVCFFEENWVYTPERRAAHRFLARHEIEEAFEGLSTYVLGAEEAKKYSLHSFRSYLACALMAAGCSDAQIQAALRWASDGIFP